MAELEQHHRYSASGGEGWMTCAGKIAMETPFPDTSSPAADDGSATHFMGAECLQKEEQANTHLGKKIVCWEKPGARDGQSFAGEPLPANAVVRSTWPVDQERVDYTQEYCDFVTERAVGGELLVEERVHFGKAIGVEGAFGTADTIIIKPTNVTSIDLKYGFKRVEAENNPQLMLYGLGALDDLGLVYDLDGVETITLIIFQPRINNISEWTCTVEHLRKFANKAKKAVARSEEALALYQNKYSSYDADEWEEEYLTPSEKGCMWCKAKGVCRAYAKDSIGTMLVSAATDDGLEDLDSSIDSAIRTLPTTSFADIAAIYGAIPKIEQWVKAVEQRMFEEMMAGEKTVNFKLVVGQQGNRAWSDAEAAEVLMKSMRLKEAEMYERKIISVATAEKTLKKAYPRKWKKLEGEISRSAGKTIIVPASDKRQSTNPYDDDIALLPILAAFDPEKLVSDVDDLI